MPFWDHQVTSLIQLHDGAWVGLHLGFKGLMLLQLALPVDCEVSHTCPSACVILLSTPHSPYYSSPPASHFPSRWTLTQHPTHPPTILNYSKAPPASTPVPWSLATWHIARCYRMSSFASVRKLAVMDIWSLSEVQNHTESFFLACSVYPWLTHSHSFITWHFFFFSFRSHTL